MAWDNNAETLLGEELTNILDSNDISVYSAEQTENGMSIGLEFYSDLGEDVIVDIDCKDKDDFVKKFGEYAQDFDVNEHAEMWIEGRGTNGVPESIADLLEDAQSIKNFLEQVSDELEGKEHTRESAEVTVSFDKEELDKNTCRRKRRCVRRGS